MANLVITIEIADEHKERVLNAFSEILPYNVDASVVSGKDEETKIETFKQSLENFILTMTLQNEGQQPNQTRIQELKDEDILL